MFIKTKARTKHQSNSYYAGKCLLGGGVTKEETEGGEPCSLLALPPSDLHSKVTFVGIPVSLLDNSDRGVTCNDGCGGDLLIRTVVPCLHGHRTVVGPPLQDQLLHPRIFFLGIELECITKVLGRETLVVSSLSSPSQSCSEDSSSKRPKSQPCMFD